MFWISYSLFLTDEYGESAGGGCPPAQFAMVLVACFEAGNAVVLAHLIAHAFQGGGWRSLLFGCLGVTDSLARCYGIILARRDLRFTARGARLQYNGMNIPVGKYSVSDDFSYIVNRDRLDECETRSGQNLSAQVNHGAVLPQKDMENRAVAVG